MFILRLSVYAHVSRASGALHEGRASKEKKSLEKKKTENGGTCLVQGQLPQMLGKIKHTSDHHLSQAPRI